MAHTIKSHDALESLRLELRRGCLPLAVLSALREEQYGYSLRKLLASQGLEIDESTLYPLLRRLESQGLLRSEWREQESRKKRFYKLLPIGEKILHQLTADWNAINVALGTVMGHKADPTEVPEPSSTSSTITL